MLSTDRVTPWGCGLQLPLAAAAAVLLSSGVEANNHTSALDVRQSPGQVRVQTLKRPHQTGQLSKHGGPDRPRRNGVPAGFNLTCVDWMTVRSLIRLNPAPIGALSPAVPKLILLQNLVLKSSRRPSATRDSTWARVQRFYIPGQNTHTHTPRSSIQRQPLTTSCRLTNQHGNVCEESRLLSSGGTRAERQEANSNQNRHGYHG